MKQLHIALSLALLALCSCGNKTSGTCDNVKEKMETEAIYNTQSALRVQEQKYKKSGRYSKIELEMEAPMDNDAVSVAIRRALLAELDSALAFKGDMTRSIALYTGDASDVKAALGYYGAKVFQQTQREAKDNYEERQKLMEEMADEQGADMEEEEIMRYTMDLDIDKEYETTRYCVFSIDNEVYLGGPHGASIGKEGMVFSKSDGSRFTAFFKSGTVKQLQTLLRQGLISYFAKGGEKVSDKDLDNWLQLDGTLIPLPKDGICPTKSGLELCYAQYEIGPYALGKPKFTIPYRKIKEYLTPQAIELLGL